MSDNDNAGMPSFVFKAFVVNTHAYDEGYHDSCGAWMYFPSKPDEIAAVLKHIGLPEDAVSPQYFMDDYVAHINGLAEALPLYGDIKELTALAKAIYNLDVYDINKLDAIQSSPMKFTEMWQFAEYPWNTDYFVLDNTIKNDYTLGLDWLATQGLGEIPDECMHSIEPSAFGAYARATDGGHFTESGYIMKSGDHWHHQRPQNPCHEKPSIKSQLEEMKQHKPAQTIKPEPPVKGDLEI